MLASLSQHSTLGRFSRNSGELHSSSASWYVTGFSQDLLTANELFRAGRRYVTVTFVVSQRLASGTNTVCLILSGDAETDIHAAAELVGGPTVAKIRECEQALARNPKDVGAAGSIGYLLLQIGRKDEACEAFAHAADCYEDAGFFEQAIKVCVQLQSLDPSRVELTSRRADLRAKFFATRQPDETDDERVNVIRLAQPGSTPDMRRPQPHGLRSSGTATVESSAETRGEPDGPRADEIFFSEKRVRIDALLQTRTYSGLVEGIPTREMNDRIIESALLAARRWRHAEKPLLLPSEETPIILPSGATYAFGTPVSLPQVQCTAYLVAMDGRSALTVVWFQNDFALPLASNVEKQMRAIDWDKVAEEYSP